MSSGVSEGGQPFDRLAAADAETVADAETFDDGGTLEDLEPGADLADEPAPSDGVERADDVEPVDEVEPTRTEVTATGDARVDAALGRLPELDRLATAEHVTVYDEVHRSLQETLAAAQGDGRPPAPAGPRPGGPTPPLPGPPRR